MLDELKSLGREVLALSHDSLLLAGLESQRAGISLVIMLAAGLMLAVLLIAAWLALLGFAVLIMIENAVSLHNALLLVMALNLILVLILFGVVRRNSRHLAYPALLNTLKPPTASAAEQNSRP